MTYICSLTYQYGTAENTVLLESFTFSCDTLQDIHDRYIFIITKWDKWTAFLVIRLNIITKYNSIMQFHKAYISPVPGLVIYPSIFLTI